jgi:hypothetical protein
MRSARERGARRHYRKQRREQRGLDDYLDDQRGQCWRQCAMACTAKRNGCQSGRRTHNPYLRDRPGRVVARRISQEQKRSAVQYSAFGAWSIANSAASASSSGDGL